jgi:HAD superfamily hydrolase (TIGR01509 family)
MHGETTRSFYGGLPHILLEPDAESKSQYLERLNREIYLRDLRERYDMREDGNLMKFSAVLCDMDGTLFDTERIYHAGWNYAGVPDEVYRQLIGRDHSAIRRLIASCVPDVDEAYKEKKEYCDELLAQHVPLKDGMEKAMKWLKEHGYRTAIATSSAKAVADHYLTVTGTAGYFDSVVSGHDLEHGKPAPDIYLLAAKSLDADPSSCVVVEDSRNGILSGKAAGMKTVLIPDEFQPDDETMEAADVILHSLDELPLYLQMINGVGE